MLNEWAGRVFDRQLECATPAIVRTWIQTWDDADFKYDAAAIQRQIVALYDANVPGGYMLWHGNGSLHVAEKLPEVIKYDYGALYKEARAQNKILSDYMNIPTEDKK